MKAIRATGYKPVSYDDESGNHTVDGIELKAHKIEAPKDEIIKEEKGAAKCGSGKCRSKLGVYNV